MSALKTYLRYLLKNKLYTAITIFGFAIALTFILLLSVYIRNELSVDEFQVNKERIYRLENETVDFSPPIAEDLKKSIPEIEDFTRVYNESGRISVADGQKIKFDYLGVDASFLNIFSFPLLEGKTNDVLQTADGIVLSKAMALKLFGSVDVIGKGLFINTDNKFIVTGVMDDFPENTHFAKQDALVNLKAFKKIWGFENIMEEYGWCSLSIYFLAKVNADLPAKAPEILKKFKKDFWLYTEGWANTVEFTPLKDIYFSSKEGNGTKSTSKILLTVLSSIVLLILFLAIGNYINLTMAQATFRGKEVAIKKLLGSSKRQVIIQLIRESVFLCFSALILALVLAKLAEPYFDSLLNSHLNLNKGLNLINLIILIGIFGLIGFLSGIVPALKISNFKPIEVVKGTFRTQVKGTYGKAFITFQYTVTIALLACSWIILKQTNFLRNKDLGFRKDNIVHLDYLSSTDKKSTIKNALLQIPGVEDVSITWQSPLSGGSNQTFENNGKSVSFQEFAVDTSFFKVFDIKVKPTDVAYTNTGMYLNETAIRELGLTDEAVSFKMEENEIPILGIVNDFNFKELRDRIGPLMIRQQSPNFQANDIFLKVNGKDILGTTNKIKATYTSLIDDAEFEVQFVDDTIDNWYEKDERTGKIISYFTLLSFLISGMGILGMSTFYMQQRTKEIGIRKVNGATSKQILNLLNKDFLKWVGLAFIIAVPISWYAMNRWLEGFAYKTNISWWIFALAGLMTVLIAILTISFHAIRSARANPIKSLRTE
tara:strand:+ start:2106 stop:4415 length:2310 start_codon:yes stop_codon:yes gene_type:complete